jgi:SAM-dependent methyltransferase
MDPDTRQRLSAIAHATSSMWGPIPEDTIRAVVERVALDLSPGARVVDLGCGPAELLRRLVEQTGAIGLGVDASPYAIAEAAVRVAGSPAARRLELRVADVHALERAGTHDLAIVMGPGWAHDGWTALTSWAAEFVRPGGHLLLGDGAWRRPPTDAELDLIQMPIGAYPASGAVEDAVRLAGAAPVWSTRVTEADWNAYGRRYRAALAQFVADHPTDALAPMASERAGPLWPTFDVLHDVLDFVIVLAGIPEDVGALR